MLKIQLKIKNNMKVTQLQYYKINQNILKKVLKIGFLIIIKKIYMLTISRINFILDIFKNKKIKKIFYLYLSQLLLNLAKNKYLIFNY